MTEQKPQTYDIRTGSIDASPFRGGMDEMNQALDSAQPDLVTKGGKTYNDAATLLGTTAGILRSSARQLEQIWKGEDADAAVKQMGRLERTAKDMQRVSHETGRSLSTFGEQLKWYVDHRPKAGLFKGISFGTSDLTAMFAGNAVVPGLGGPIAVGGKKLGEVMGILENEEDKAAREFMDRLSGRAVEANAALPAAVTTDLPHVDRNVDIPTPTPPKFDGGGGGGLPGGGGAGGGLPGAGGGGAGIGSPPGGGGLGGGLPGSGGGLPGGGAGGLPGGGGGGLPGSGGGGLPGGGLPGYNGGGGTDLAGTPPGGGGLPGGGGGLPGGGGGLPGGGLPGGGAGGGLPGGGAGLGGMPMGGPGSGAGRGAGLGGAGRGAAGMGGMGGSPMGGGGRGGGKGEEENERTTWLMEDEDVWGGSDGDAAPPVIG
ncbi:WXG100 family type VII secretion target [Actinomadura flavalba]|uniref:WXG100 family type VII secretion target n=1 Tax=Actinomadura flavalba TaxID=1120938 RepID=UPI0012DCB49D|nr:hypothetical protein [Actinomadura flavalba]